jgi:hypothetical protein
MYISPFVSPEEDAEDNNSDNSEEKENTSYIPFREDKGAFFFYYIYE